MRHLTCLTLSFFAFVLSLACATPALAHVAPALTIGGGVERSLALTVENLRQRPSTELAEVRVAGKFGSRSVVRGVRLRDLLKEAGIVTTTTTRSRSWPSSPAPTTSTPWCSHGTNCSTPGPARTCWCCSNATASRCPMPKGRWRSCPPTTCAPARATSNGCARSKCARSWNELLIGFAYQAHRNNLMHLLHCVCHLTEPDFLAGLCC